MEHFLMAIEHLLSFQSLFIVVVGTLVGVIVGALPGLGSVIGITLCIPFTFTMDHVQAITLLVGVYAGSTYGGSVSAILINTPGTPQAAATCLDGFPMVLKGKAEESIGWATFASVFGGTISCFILLLAAPQLAALAMKFGPVETFALILMGMTCIATVSQGNMFKGVLAACIGLFLGCIGADPLSGDIRFTWDIFVLSGGIDIIPVLVGIFALSEVLSRIDILARNNVTNIISCKGLKLPGLRDLKTRWGVLFKSSIIGSFVGIMPGVGGAPAAFISYGEAKRSSPRKAQFGQGEPDGILAPESANNAVTGGALVPTLALGLPGDAATAVMLATLMIHGVTPGVRLMVDSPDIVYAIFLVLFLCNFCLIPTGMLITKGFSWLLRLHEAIFLPMVVIICILGTYGVRNSYFDLVVALIAGALGIVLRYFKVSPAPLVIGLVLGPQLEISLRQSLLVTRGGMLSMFTEHPIALVLFLVTVLLLAWPVVQSFREKKCAL